MSDIVEDMLGRKFDVEQDEKGNEVWRSQEYPEFTFESIEKYKDENGFYVLDSGGSDCCYKEAIGSVLRDTTKGKSSSLTGDPAELLDIMPITKQMFIPLINNQAICGTAYETYTRFVCNSGSAVGGYGHISIDYYVKYGPAAWREKETRYLNPGSLQMATAQIKSFLYKTIEKSLTKTDFPMEKLNIIQQNFNKYNNLISSISVAQYKTLEKIFADNAQLILKDNPEHAQELFDGFSTIYYRDYHNFEYTNQFYEHNYEAKNQFYSDMAKYAPDVLLANVSKIIENEMSNHPTDISIFERCKEIYERGGNYAPQALDCILSHASVTYLGDVQDRSSDWFNTGNLLYKIAEQNIPNSDKVKIAEWLVSKEHIATIPSFHASEEWANEGKLVDFINRFSESQKSLSPKFCEGVFYFARQQGYEDGFWQHNEGLTPVFQRIINDDLSYYKQNIDVFDKSGLDYSQQVALKDHSIIPSLKGISRENFDAFAKIYEDEYKKASYGVDENNLKQKNVVLEKENNEIMDTIKTKILENSVAKPVQVWLVKNAQKYPNLVSDCLKTTELPYVEMCIKNIENPEKENIGSLLNRLEVKEAKTFEDFQDAQDFVARRDMCMRACRTYDNEKQKEFHAEHPKEDNVRLATFDRSQLSYDMAEVGIDDFKTAKRVAKLFYTLNERPETYGSDYNQYYPQALLPIAKSDVMQDWMYPVMMDAIEKGGLTISEGRMPSERTLFDCCKAWKINPAMPQRLAKFVGTHSLKGRMLAGAIFDKMVTDGKTTPEEWRDNKVLHEKFYEELARAEKMPREKAFQQYIPNTPVNRKRVIGMGMEEKGIENTPENFKALYKEAREQGVFEKLLAKPEEARTTFSSRLLVETARRKAARE